MTNEELAWFLTTFLNIVRNNSIKTINVKKIPRFEESIEKAIEILTESKTGEWIYLYGSIGSYMTMSCSFCGETFNDVAEWKYNYCPNCGARMRGEEE